MEKELQEFNDALYELRTAVHGLHRQALDTRDAIGKSINDANLRGTIGMLTTDIAFRDMIARAI